MPHTVCIGFANEQAVIAATIAHTVTSHSTQRLAKIKVKKLYLLIMPTLLWIKGGVAWSKHKTCFIAFSNNATTRTSLICGLVKRTAPKHTGGRIKSKIQRSFLRLPAVHKKTVSMERQSKMEQSKGRSQKTSKGNVLEGGMDEGAIYKTCKTWNLNYLDIVFERNAGKLFTPSSKRRGKEQRVTEYRQFTGWLVTGGTFIHHWQENEPVMNLKKSNIK